VPQFVETWVAPLLSGIVATIVAQYLLNRHAGKPTDERPRILLKDGTPASTGRPTRFALRLTAPQRLALVIGLPAVFVIVWAGGSYAAAWLAIEQSARLPAQIVSVPFTWWVAVAVLAALVVWIARDPSRAVRFKPNSPLVLGLAVALLAALTTPWLSTAAVAHAQRLAFDRTVERIDAGDVDTAGRKLDSMLSWEDLDPSLLDNVLGRRAQVLFKNGDFAGAAEMYAQIVEQYPDSEIASNALQSLMWSVRRMPEQYSLGDTVPRVQELAERHPGLGIRVAWVGIDPGYWTTLQTEPGSALARSTRLLSGKDREKLTFVARPDAYTANEPDERAIAMWLLGDYERASETAEDPEIVSKALFQLGESHYEVGRFSKAEDAYARLLDTVPEMPLADDACYRMGRARELRGDVVGACEAYARALRLPDGDAQSRVQRRLAFVVEMSTESGLDEIASASALAPSVGQAIVRRLLCLGAYAEANTLAATLGETSGLSEDERAVVARLAEGGDDASPAQHAARGALLLEKPAIVYNPEWRSGRVDYLYAVESTVSAWADSINDYTDVLPPGYRSEENAYARAAAEFEAALGDQWNPAWALLLLESYCELAEPGSFVDSPQDRAAYLAAALRLAERVQQSNDLPASERTHAQDLIAQIALAGGTYDYDAVIERFTLLADRYPEDERANNALKWTAWAWEEKAAEEEPGSSAYLDAYRSASAVYERILAEYPQGHVARESAAALKECRSVIKAWE
jgi:tetratricopeptide (TPR) repeat protein